MLKSRTDKYQDIRDAVRALCAESPDEYHRKIDDARAYPEAFVDALPRHGSQPQKDLYLLKIASGEWRPRSMGVTEPSTGTDTTQIKKSMHAPKTIAAYARQ